MNNSQNQSRWRSALKTGLRLLITVLLAVGIGAGAYFTTAAVLPRVREQYLDPVRENANRLDSLTIRLEDSLNNLQSRLESLSGRINQAEISLDQQKATQSAWQSELTGLQNTQVSLQETAAAGRARLEELESMHHAFTTQSARRSDLLSHLATQQIPPSALDIQERMTILRELLLRAKIALNHDNYGLAREDLEQAVSLLKTLQGNLYPYQYAYTQEIQAAAATALESLGDAPDLAGDAVDFAWQLAAAGLPSSPQEARPTRTPTAVPTPTPTPPQTVTPTPAG